MNKTKIEWCDFTVNPVKYRDSDGKSVWACVKVSDGCKNCYAEALAKRYGRGGPYTVGQTAKVTPYLDEAELRQMLSVKRLPPGSRVFVGDMTDIFGEWVTDEMLDGMFAVFALRPDVVFQVLTKRPDAMRGYFDDPDVVSNVEAAADEIAGEQGWCHSGDWSWPLPNVWLGTSVEDQEAADKRIPELKATPAAVHFISGEPLLGSVDITADVSPPERCQSCGRVYSDVWYAPSEQWNRVEGGEGGLRCPECYGRDACAAGVEPTINRLGEVGPRIDWVIVGGESGPGARPMDVAWARSLVSQCRAAGVAVFVKQLGAKPYTALDDVTFGTEARGAHPDKQMAWVPRYGENWGPLLRDRKGGDMSEWPADLRVREFPL